MLSRNSFPWVFWSILALTTAPINILYFVQLWPIAHYQFFPVLILAVGLLFVSRWDRQLLLPSTWLAWGLISGSLAFSLTAAFYWSPWLGCVGLVCLLGAFLHTQNGIPSNKWGLLHLWPACCLLLRLPLNLDFQLTGWLQTSTASVSSHLLDRIGLPHRLAGNVFTLSKGTLFVEAACSGVQSLFSVLFCALLLVAWNRRSPVLIPLYIAAAVLWAGIMNIVRVVTIAVAQEWWEMDLAHGWRHETLGYLCLGVAVLLLLSTDRGLRVLFYPVPYELDGNRRNPVSGLWNRLFQNMTGLFSPTIKSTSSILDRFSQPLCYGVMILMICGSFVPQVWAALRHYSEITEARQTDYWAPQQNLLAAIPEVKVLDFQSFKDSANPTLGVNAHLWVCEVNGVVTRVVTSQHTEVHDLCNCYKGNGWRINDRERKLADGWDYISADFVDADTVYGSLLFSTLDSKATPVRLSSWTVKDLFKSRTSDRDSPDQVSFHGVSVNIQLWTTSETPISPKDKELLEKTHLKMREVIRQDLAQSHPKN